MASGVILGRSTAGSGDSEELLPASVRTLLNIEDGAAADQSAGEVAVTTTNFNGLLSASDASVQAALETLDDVVISNTAASTTFSTSSTWINSTNVQAAIEELDDAAFPITQTAYDLLTAQEQTERNWLIVDASNSVDASTVSYDNTSSGLTATDVEAAIDEIEARVDLNDAKVTNTDAQDLTLSGNTLAVSGDPNTDVDISTATAVAANTAKVSEDKFEVIQVACSDLSTDVTTGTTKAYFRMPYAATVTDVRVSLLAAGTATGLTVDINEDGTSILSTKLTTDATEKTSETATTAAVISDSALADDAEITIDFDAVPTSGQGVIVTLIVTRI